MNAIRMQGNSAQDRAYSVIKERLLCFSVRPTERIRAHEVAAELGISRTPVREALCRLEQEGFVVRDSGWGYVVKPIVYAEVVGLFRVREILEVEAARQAAVRCEPELLKGLARLLTTAERNLQAAKISEFQKANRAFHAVLEHASGNAVLEDMLSKISDRIRMLGSMVLERSSARGHQILEENRAIYSALEKRDLDELERAAKAHVQLAADYALQYIRGENQYFPERAVA